MCHRKCWRDEQLIAEQCSKFFMIQLIINCIKKRDEFLSLTVLWQFSNVLLLITRWWMTNRFTSGSTKINEHMLCVRLSLLELTQTTKLNLSIWKMIEENSSNLNTRAKDWWFPRWLVVRICFIIVGFSLFSIYSFGGKNCLQNNKSINNEYLR